jgi:hypothetical protein
MLALLEHADMIPSSSEVLGLDSLQSILSVHAAPHRTAKVSV